MKILAKKKSKGKTSAKVFSTACQNYSPDMREYVFAIKGRPFAMLSSQKLPVPPVSLIDYNLVRDLGLEMHDLQCTKYTFGGMKLRILGRISQTLQTIQDGAISGTAHVRANVVENLYQVFDTHSVAGQQMITSLMDSPARQEDSQSDVSGAESSPRHRTQPKRERKVPQVLPTPDPPGARPSPDVADARQVSSLTAPGPPEAKPAPARPAGINGRPDYPWGRVVSTTTGSHHLHATATVVYEDDQGQLNSDTIPNIADRYIEKMKAGDAVLLARRKPNSSGQPPEYKVNLMRIIPEKEVGQIRILRGETFPEVPPDLHPGGYYG